MSSPRPPPPSVIDAPPKEPGPDFRIPGVRSALNPSTPVPGEDLPGAPPPHTSERRRYRIPT